MIPEIYGVYLLQSVDHPKSFYIGSTPNPLRRLRQHNGLVRGGAFRTRKNRPWRMILFVNRFPSRVAALQFESAWQHAKDTRYLKPKGGNTGRTLKAKLGNVIELMVSNGFKRMGLKLTVFHPAVLPVIGETYLKQIEVQDFVDHSDAPTNDDDGNYTQLKQFMKSEIDSQLDYRGKSLESYDEHSICRICSEEIGKEKLVGVCITCHVHHHLNCWYVQSLHAINGINQLVPTISKCVKCSSVNNWNLIVRNSLSVHDKINKTLIQN